MSEGVSVSEGASVSVSEGAGVSASESARVVVGGRLGVGLLVGGSLSSRAWALAGGAAIFVVSRVALGAPGAPGGAGGPEASQNVGVVEDGDALVGVSILVDPCAGVPSAFVDRVVSAELSGDQAAGPAVDVRVTCREGLVVVAASMEGAEPLVRNVDLAREDPQARSRVLCVAIAETVAAIRSQPPVPPPAPEPATLPAAEPMAPTPVPAPHARPWTLGVAGVARSFASLTGFGAGAWASYLTRAHVGLRADVDAADANVGVALGSVEARMASVGVQGIAGGTWGPFALEGGAGARVGVASLEGHPGPDAVGHTVTGAWGGPLALVVAGWRFAPAWSIFAATEAGWVARETTGLVAQVPRVSVQGGWWGGGLGLAWSP